MKLDGVHLLLSYQCTFECDHCFVWGSPQQQGTMTLGDIREILRQAVELGGVEWIYFEGGEPLLFYPIFLRGVEDAVKEGFLVGVVTNAYWATCLEDAIEWLRPLAGKVQDLSLSSDLFHFSERQSKEVKAAAEAAGRLGIPVGLISIAKPEEGDAAAAEGQLPLGESRVMYRGRAVEKLASDAPKREWRNFTECPYENLRDPGRVHIDPIGNVHVCQGISIGNIKTTPLAEICRTYDPERDPIIGPLLSGGPAGLAKRHGLPLDGGFADACHFCYEARLMLRPRFPRELGPDQMYGVME